MVDESPRTKVSWGGARYILEVQLGFSYNDVRKGVYIDKFDADENVEFRNNTMSYLPKCREVDRRVYRYVPLSWRAQCDKLDIKIHPSHLNPDGSLIRDDTGKPQFATYPKPTRSFCSINGDAG